MTNSDFVFGVLIGDAGDSLNINNNMFFSTKDRDNDVLSSDNCASFHAGAWWYTQCHEANLNGLYLNGTNNQYANGIVWKQWKGYEYSLKRAEMKIRPV